MLNRVCAGGGGGTGGLVRDAMCAGARLLHSPTATTPCGIHTCNIPTTYTTISPRLHALPDPGAGNLGAVWGPSGPYDIANRPEKGRFFPKGNLEDFAADKEDSQRPIPCVLGMDTISTIVSSPPPLAHCWALFAEAMGEQVGVSFG